MYIKCWGSRGSIPISGKEYTKYGGDTTCVEIRTKDNDIIIIDAGTGIRRLGNKLIQEKPRLYHLFFTHAHWDHVMGFPFFKPIYSKDVELRMYRCPFPNYTKKMLSAVMNYPHFPVKYAHIQARVSYEAPCSTHFKIGSVKIIPVKLSHPNTASGFKFIEDDKTFVFMTDNELGHVHRGGLPYEAYVEFVSGADMLFHDAEYTPEEYERFKTFGHSTYIQTLNLAFDAGVKKFGMFHLNQDRTDKQMDEIVKICKKQIAKKKSKLEWFAVASDMEFVL